MTYRDAYHARTTIAEAMYWLRTEDGWTWDDLMELGPEEVERLQEDEDEQGDSTT